MNATPTATLPADLLRVTDLDAEQLQRVLDLAARMRKRPDGWVKALRGQSLACFFEKPSTRTRVSFQAAAFRLGMQPIMLRPDELQLGRGEPLADTARALSSYTAAIVMRTFAQQTLEELAAAAEVPVINALSDAHHPCQALADLLTLRDHFGRLAGLRLAFVGAGNNVATSLCEAGALAGMHVVVASPEPFGLRPELIRAASQLAEAHGGSVRAVVDPREAVAGADAVYTDVWVSMGEEREQRERIERLVLYQVNSGLMERAAPGAVFLHCLPAHRGQEVTSPVIDGPASLVWPQAANRLPTEQALVYLLVTGEWP